MIVLNSDTLPARVDILKCLSVSFTVTDRPPSILVAIDSPHLDRKYLGFLKDLERFYADHSPSVLDDYRKHAVNLSCFAVRQQGSTFLWNATPHAERVSDVFPSVYNACIRPALYLALKNSPR